MRSRSIPTNHRPHGRRPAPPVGALAAALFVAACGSAPPAPTKTAAVATARVTSAVQSKGPKLRVVTAPFQELEAAKALMAQMGITGVGAILGEQITTTLTETGRVMPFERAQIETIIGEQKTTKEGELAKYFDASTTVETGKFKGAQAKLVGVVTQFEPNISSKDASLDLKLLAGMKYHEDKAVVGIELRLVDATTGRILIAAPGVGEIVARSVDGEATYSGIGLKAGAYERTPLGTATRKACEKALAALTAKLDTLPWEGEVANVAGPEKVFIDAGANVDLQPGARFRVIHRGAPVTGADGSVIGFDDTEAGVVEVVQVQEKMSIARVVEGEGPKKAGDRVRYLPAGR
ncbi:CsgG/HfaB family protein [Myxococcota bacterium]|nr:CsgG/HfaB family protein [Myxococcota bacterium]